MTRYDEGRRFEWLTRDRLTADGYELLRTAGSRSVVDLVAIKWRQIVLVQCKRDAVLRPIERVALLRLAALLPGIALPILAYRPGIRGQRVAFAVLTGPGAHDRQPWTPDEAAEADAGGLP